ncbi:hypothetical protein R5R35_001234 [Gryllus longicercus]|uniref:C2H2-type domain-containing protein n=1 Tax=Gryllus longicercus TaxID=2509291 RepID=A0AAN9Z0L1_9ORTH
MEKLVIKKICPLPAELSEIKKNIPCSEEGCNRMFLNSSNLDMHLLKHHKKSNKIVKINSDVKYQYHCPIDKCSYNVKSERFFKNMKYLKQHFLKVHAEKSFCCDQCHKGFSTEAAQKKHERLCGVKFICSCNYSYDSYEALITHAKRHQHTFDEKYKSFGKEVISTGGSDDPCSKMSTCSLQDVHSASSSAIAVPVHLLAAVALNELSNTGFGTSFDKEVQTDSKGDNKRHRKVPSPCRAFERSFKRRTTHTQTGQVSRAKHPKISTQTQTMGDYILKKAMHAADILIMPTEEVGVTNDSITGRNRKRRKSMETQTTSNINLSVCENREVINIGAKFSPTLESNINMSSLSNFPSTSYSHLNNNTNMYHLDADELPDLWFNQKNSLGTQTSPVALSSLFGNDEMLNHTVTQTDLNLTLFDSETCESHVPQHNSHRVTNLQNYFEDSTDSNFNPHVISTSFGQELTNTTIDNLTSLAEGPDYSSAQLGNLLGNGNKVFDANRSCSTETQTEIDVNCFLSDCDNDTSFTLCSNIETQTTEEFSSLDQLLYSNMCTQTCDEILLSELGFADIETQTAWPQYTDDSSLVSTETQTSLSVPAESQHPDKEWLITNKDALAGTSHMETQTNVNDFQKIIAELVKEDTNDNLL